MSTTYGKNIKITVYGGSHQECIGVRATGLPEGFAVDLSALSAFMSRRAPGKNEFSTKRQEPDLPVFLSGLDGGRINGEELHAVIYNKDQRSGDYDSTRSVPRPSHADLAARMKYGETVDLRGGGHFSGRLTAPLCIVGGICLQYLNSLGISIGAHIYRIGNISDTPFDLASVGKTELELLSGRYEFPVLDTVAGEQMKSLIRSASAEGDSVGGIIECAAVGLPAGLGEHMFDGMENRISAAVFGIPAVKGIEFGNGFACAGLFGSQNNDAIILDGDKIKTRTNNCGGILGGMTNGMPLVFRSAMKPTPSIYKEQDSVDTVSMTPVKLSLKGRHDPCIVLRAVPVVEAVTAIAICDALFDREELQ